MSSERLGGLEYRVNHSPARHGSKPVDRSRRVAASFAARKSSIVSTPENSATNVSCVGTYHKQSQGLPALPSRYVIGPARSSRSSGTSSGGQALLLAVSAGTWDNRFQSSAMPVARKI